MRIPTVYHPELDRNVQYAEGTLLVSNKSGKLMKCVHFDSKDTILEDVETGKTGRVLNSMTLNRYYTLAIKGYNYEAN